jgi:hypothetical protein
MRTELLRFNGAVEQDPAIDAWMKAHAGELGAIAHQWFDVMRRCGDEVRELLPDPDRLLQGAGKFMRHVKLRPGTATDAGALSRLIEAAYSDIKERVEVG